MSKNKDESTLERVERARSIGGCPPSLGIRPQRDPNIVLWNLRPSKHAKVAVYRRVTRWDGWEDVIKLFRGSPLAFRIWRKNHAIPPDAEIINESVQR